MDGSVRAVRAVRAVLAAVVALVAAGCWPVPGHDPDWSGYNELETALTPGTVAALEERWTWPASPSSAFPVRSPVLSSGGLHVAVGCELVTIDARSGAELWRVVPPPDSPPPNYACYMHEARDPFVIGDVVYFGGVYLFGGKSSPMPITPFFDASTSAWDVRTGEHVAAADDVSGALAAHRDGVVATVDGYAGLRAVMPPYPIFEPFHQTWTELGPLTGPQRWLPGPNDGRVTVGTETAYTVAGASVTAFAVHDPDLTCGGGTAECPLWTATLDGSVTGRPVISADGTTLYVGTQTGTVYALDAATGATSWQAAVGSPVTDSVARAHDTLYVPTDSGDLVAVAAGGCGAATCTPAWSAPTGARISGQPVVAGNVVVTGSTDGALRAFDATGCGAATCPALWSTSTGSEISGLAVTGGTVYAGTADGRVVAYGLPADG